MNIVIDQEFKSLIPPLSTEERRHLEENLLRDGCRDPLVVWNGTLIDGHNRHEICTRHSIPFEVEEMQFDSREDAIVWIIKNQFGRRNLSDYTRGVLVLRMEQEIAKKAKANQVAALKQNATVLPNLAERSEPIDTREELAKAAGVSHGTIAKVKKIEKAEEPELKKALASETVSIHAAETFIKAKEINPDLVFKHEHAKESMKEAREIVKVEEEKKKHVHVSANSGNNEWYTPEDYIEAARRTLGGIDIDPASNDIAQQKVKAAIYYTAETNGLDKDWNGKAWMNPPYASTLIGQFCERMKQQAECGNVTAACVLVNNATETRWFADLISVASAVVFTKGRVRFLDPEGNPGGAPLQGQAIVYIGPDPNVFIHEFANLGWGATI